MRILLISQYFWPETFIINELVETLTQQGHTIKVLTGKPNYPNGEIFAGYTKKELFLKVLYPVSPYLEHLSEAAVRVGQKILF